MSKLYDYIEKIRKETTADEINVYTSLDGMVFTFAWNVREPSKMWFYRKMFTWGELDHLTDAFIIRTVTSLANEEITKHIALTQADDYKRAMRIVQ